MSPWATKCDASCAANGAILRNAGKEGKMIYASYFFQLADDSAALMGVQRGAAALRASTEFRQLVCSGDLPQDMIGADTPLCSVAYKYMFHACCVPKLHQDSY
jgi:carnitine O-acetyltransferase